MKPERNAAAELQTEARRACGFVRISARGLRGVAGRAREGGNGRPAACGAMRASVPADIGSW